MQTKHARIVFAVSLILAISCGNTAVVRTEPALDRNYEIILKEYYPDEWRDFNGFALEPCDMKEAIHILVCPEIWEQSDASQVTVESGQVIVEAPERVHILIRQLFHSFAIQPLLQINPYDVWYIGYEILDWDARNKVFPDLTKRIEAGK